jgi:hypothetical protein
MFRIKILRRRVEPKSSTPLTLLVWFPHAVKIYAEYSRRELNKYGLWPVTTTYGFWPVANKARRVDDKFRTVPWVRCERIFLHESTAKDMVEPSIDVCSFEAQNQLSGIQGNASTSPLEAGDAIAVLLPRTPGRGTSAGDSEGDARGITSWWRPRPR